MSFLDTLFKKKQQQTTTTNMGSSFRPGVSALPTAPTPAQTMLQKSTGGYQVPGFLGALQKSVSQTPVPTIQKIPHATGNPGLVGTILSKIPQMAQDFAVSKVKEEIARPKGTIGEEFKHTVINRPAQIFKTLSQGLLSSASTVGKTVIDLAYSKKLGTENASTDPALNKFFFGSKEEPKSYQQISKDITDYTVNSPIATPWEKKHLGPLVAVAGFATDVFTGGAERSVLKTIAKEVDEQIIKDVALKAGFPKEIIERSMPKLVSAKTEKEVKAAFLEESNKFINETKDGTIPIDHTIPPATVGDVVQHNTSGEKFRIVDQGPKGSKVQSLKTGETLNINTDVLQNKFTQSADEALTAKKTIPLNKPQEAGDIIQNTPASDIYINTRTLNIPEESKKIIQTEINKLGDQIDSQIGKRLSNKEIVEKAGNIEKAFLDVSDKESQLKFLADIEKQRQTLTSILKDGKITSKSIEAIKDLKALSAFRGRVLQAANVVTDPIEKSMMMKMVDNIEKITGKDLDDVLAKAKDVDFNDAEQATKFYRDNVKPKAEEWIDLLRYNSMLSNPVTWISNVSSTLGSLLIRPFVKTVAGGIDKVLSVLNPARPRTQLTREGLAYLKGSFKASSFKEAATKFKDVWSGKNLIENEFTTRNIALTTKDQKIARGFENMLRSVGKIMESSDQFLIQLAKEGETQAFKTRRAGGVKVQGLIEQAETQAERTAFRNKAEDPIDGPVLNAIGKVSNLVNEARTSKNKLLRWPAKIFIPFLQFATKGVQTGIEFNPITGWSTVYGAKNKIEQAAKATIGLGVAAGLSTLAFSGKMTGAAPTNQGDKAKWADAGIQPYSIEVSPGNWVAYDKLPPQLSFTFAFMQGIGQAYQDGKVSLDDATSLWKAFTSQGKFFTDQSFMKSIGNIHDALSGDQNAAAQLVSNVPQQAVPFKGFLTWIERLTDGKQRVPNPDDPLFKKQLQYFMMQIPGLAQQVPPRRNAQGKEITIDLEERVTNAFSPLKVKTQTPDEQRMTKFLRGIDEAKKYESMSQNEEQRRLSTYLEQIHAAKTPQEKSNIIDYITENDPQMVDKLLAKVKKEAIPLDLQYVKSLTGVDGRAYFIYNQIKKTPPEKRGALIDRLYSEKGIMTDAVIKKLSELSKSS